jgi:bacillithiol system protein YtxJ
MGLFSFISKTAVAIDWNELTSESDLHDAIEYSLNKPVLFFKHSTRCSISSMALSRFEEKWDTNEDCKLFFLDLLEYRPVSNLLAELSGVEHQSPQVIVLYNEEVIYSASHSGINASQIHELLQQLNP